MSRPLITLLTDFGDRDAYAGILQGVILSICPEARIVDLTHGIPPQDVRAGALILRSAVPYFPDGSIHVAVVDPGVGSARGAVLVVTPRATFIGPDNGLLQPAADLFGIERVVALNRSEFHRPAPSNTFHGRDVFAPVAAHLARGVAPESLGSVQPDLVALELPAPKLGAGGVEGEVIHIDTFGNLVTNITAAELDSFRAQELSVSMPRCASIPLVSTYADVEPGSVLALIDSWGHLEIAMRDGNAAEKLGAGAGCAVHVKA